MWPRKKSQVRLKIEHLSLTNTHTHTLADVLFWHAADYVFMSVYLFIKRKSSSDGGGPRAARRVPSLSPSPEIKWHVAKTHDGPWRLTTNTQTHPQGNSSSRSLTQGNVCAQTDGYTRAEREVIYLQALQL
jgi:hypothetical protein